MYTPSKKGTKGVCGKGVRTRKLFTSLKTDAH